MESQSRKSNAKGEVTTAGQRAALYLRVSTGRQAEHDLSIPDQRSQTVMWAAARGLQVVAEYIEPGASATDDRRPEFQRMVERACDGECAFDVSSCTPSAGFSVMRLVLNFMCASSPSTM